MYTKHKKNSPWSDGSHELLSRGEASQSGHCLCRLQYTMLSGHSVNVKESRSTEISTTKEDNYYHISQHS